MLHRIRRVLGKYLSRGEKGALKLFLLERKMARCHSAGLKKIRRENLQHPQKLNLGCGPHRKEGFLNVDLFPPAEVTLDLRRGLPFDSGCCDLIFSEHCFEHFDYPETILHLLRECHRVLRAGGGVLVFSVPDTEWPLSDYREGADASYFKACRENSWHPKWCMTRLEHINYHFRQGTEHRFAYDLETAVKILTAAGFVDVRQRKYDPTLDSEHRRIGSLFICARKERLPEDRRP